MGKTWRETIAQIHVFLRDRQAFIFFLGKQSTIIIELVYNPTMTGARDLSLQSKRRLGAARQTYVGMHNPEQDDVRCVINQASTSWEVER